MSPLHVPACRWSPSTRAWTCLLTVFLCLLRIERLSKPRCASRWVARLRNPGVGSPEATTRHAIAAIAWLGRENAARFVASRNRGRSKAWIVFGACPRAVLGARGARASRATLLRRSRRGAYIGSGEAMPCPLTKPRVAPHRPQPGAPAAQESGWPVLHLFQRIDRARWLAADDTRARTGNRGVRGAARAASPAEAGLQFVPSGVIGKADVGVHGHPSRPAPHPAARRRSSPRRARRLPEHHLLVPLDLGEERVHHQPGRSRAQADRRGRPRPRLARVPEAGRCIRGAHGGRTRSRACTRSCRAPTSRCSASTR